jgi:hypothetical protein
MLVDRYLRGLQKQRCSTPPVVGFLLIGLLLSGCLAVPSSTTTASLTLAPTDTPTAKSSLALNLPPLPSEEGKTWLETDTTQCGGGPWSTWEASVAEASWADCQSVCGQIDRWRERSECWYECVLRKGHPRQGIEVFDIRVVTFEEKFGGDYVALCEACSCPDGFTLYVQVSKLDVDAMLDMGYRYVVESCGSATPGADPYGCPW